MLPMLVSDALPCLVSAVGFTPHALPPRAESRNYGGPVVSPVTVCASVIANCVDDLFSYSRLLLYRTEFSPMSVMPGMIMLCHENRFTDGVFKGM